jgi:hypothetical protein
MIASVCAPNAIDVGDLYVCDAHAEQLVARARARGLEVSMWPPE